MRILYKNLKKGVIKLQLEVIDDLWYLHSLIEPGDLALAYTYRREERVKDRLRPQRVEKKKLFLGLRAEKLDFQEFSDRIRITGKIEEAPESITKGSYHTLSLGVGDVLTIVKDWKLHLLERIKEAVDVSKKPLILFLAIDYGESTFAILHSYGIELVATITRTISGKYFTTSRAEKNVFYANTLDKLKELATRLEGSPLVILGPGFAKEEFLRFGLAKEVKLFKNCHLEATGNSGIAGINELLRKGFKTKVLEETRLAKETKLVEQLFVEIVKDGKAAYGFENVKNAIERSSVELLLVIDKFLRVEKVIQILQEAKAKRSSIIIVSTTHDSGKKLEALGGIAALLRYKLS
jgi:protein pelota